MATLSPRLVGLKRVRRLMLSSIHPLSPLIFTRATLASSGISRRRRRRHVCVSVCLSVCLSHASIVSKRLNVGSRKQRHVILTPTVVGGRLRSPPKICSQGNPFPFEHHKFRPISHHSASTVRAGEQCSISTNRKSTTHFPTSHR